MGTRLTHSSPQISGQPTDVDSNRCIMDEEIGPGQELACPRPHGPWVCLITHPCRPTWAGRAWGLCPALLHPSMWGMGLFAPLLRTPHLNLPGSQGRAEACPCPMSGQRGSAGVAGYGSCQGPVHLIKSRSGVSSFYRPHKASLMATSTHSSPWHPVPPWAREDKFLLRAANLPDS